MATGDCVTYQGIKSGTCKFTPDGGSAATLNLVTSISVSPSVSLGQIKGDDDLYPRCQYVISGASSGSITATDIESVDTAITPGVAGTLVWDSTDKVSGRIVSYAISDCTFSDNSTPFATESPTADSLSFSCGSTTNDGITNPIARTFAAAP
jgi:hypothetical protein